jgi:excisionase family DNA binding protein
MQSAEGGPSTWLTTGEVAKLAGVAPETVRAWEAAGKLDAERTHVGYRLFRRVDVEAWLVEWKRRRAEAAS